jgi:beta-glucosidase
LPDGTTKDEAAFERAVATVRAGGLPEVEAQQLFDRLGDEERLWLLDGDTPVETGLPELHGGRFNERPFVHGAVPRLGIPGFAFSDGPRGCVIGPATAFPVSMARGATFDVALEEEVGDAIGREVRAVGANLYGGVCVNLLRHPAWGRAQETYGDEPLHLGEMGAALTRGVQRHAMATVKHFALNSMENARFKVDVAADEPTLHDVYLPHFRRVVDEGVAAVMSAYNSVNGEWCGQNGVLLHEVLRELWGFEGVTISDWVMGFRDAVASLEAGLDLEMPFRQQRAAALPAALAQGRCSWVDVERAGVRLIAAQLRSYATRSDGPHEVLAGAGSRALARRVASRAMVLLQNDPVDGAPVLPLDAASVRRIAVIGRLATAANLGDHGSSDVKHTPSTCSPYDGIRAAFPAADVLLVDFDDPSAAARAAAECDVAVVVAGFTAEDEGEHIPLEDIDYEASAGPLGEGGDRTSLRLRPVDEEIIVEAARANPRTVVAVVAGSAVLMEAWRGQVPAVLVMWYAGMEGGRALADVLSGAEDPSGRLPFVVPVLEEHLPAFDAEATAVTYDRLHGQRLLDATGVAPAFPYGFGLSYTSFALAEARLEELLPGSGRLSVSVTNEGDRDGRHVVQVYGSRQSGEYAGETWLLGFRPVEVAAGQSATIAVDFSLLPLAHWSPALRTRVLPDLSEVLIEVGAHAHDPAAIALPQS